MRKIKFLSNLKIYFPLKRLFYKPFNAEEFVDGLKAVGVVPGDTVYVMCSADKVYQRTGHKLPIYELFTSLLEYIGTEGTIIALGYTSKTAEIIAGEVIFDVRKTPLEGGMFCELLKRTPGSERSLHPVFSVIAYGKNAAYYCSDHHKSPYPFDEFSPYYKAMKDGGKYLGIGVGFEAFTAGHILDDQYKTDYVHKMYRPEPVRFDLIDSNGNTMQMNSYVRQDFEEFDNCDILTYFEQLQPLEFESRFLKSGVQLFSMPMKSYFESAVKIYESNKYTFWNTGSSTLIRKLNNFWLKVRELF